MHWLLKFVKQNPARSWKLGCAAFSAYRKTHSEFWFRVAQELLPSVAFGTMTKPLTETLSDTMTMTDVDTSTIIYLQLTDFMDIRDVSGTAGFEDVHAGGFGYWQDFLKLNFATATTGNFLLQFYDGFSYVNVTAQQAGVTEGGANEKNVLPSFNVYIGALAPLVVAGQTVATEQFTEAEVQVGAFPLAFADSNANFADRPIDFVDTNKAAYASVSDYAPWSYLIPLPGTAAPLDTINFTLAGGTGALLLNIADTNRSNWNDGITGIGYGLLFPESFTTNGIQPTFVDSYAMNYLQLSVQDFMELTDVYGETFHDQFAGTFPYQDWTAPPGTLPPLFTVVNGGVIGLLATSAAWAGSYVNWLYYPNTRFIAATSLQAGTGAYALIVHLYRFGHFIGTTDYVILDANANQIVNTGIVPAVGDRLSFALSNTNPPFLTATITSAGGVFSKFQVQAAIADSSSYFAPEFNVTASPTSITPIFGNVVMGMLLASEADVQTNGFGYWQDGFVLQLGGQVQLAVQDNFLHMNVISQTAGISNTVSSSPVIPASYYSTLEFLGDKVTNLPPQLEDSLTMSDEGSSLAEQLEYDLALSCPHLGQNWLDDIQFVLAPSNILISDQNEWGEPQAPNAIPFENFEYVFAPTIVNVIDHNGGLNWLDAFAFTLTTGGVLTLNLSDTLTMSDTLGIGYGEGVLTETLTITDQPGLGYGLIISDTMTMSDAVTLLMGLNINVTETLTITDQPGLGYGLAITDTMTMSDAVVIVMGLNINVTETLTITDSMGLGYGLAITDTMTMSDSVVIVLGETEQVSETLTISDSLGLGYGLVISEALTMLDALGIGYGEGVLTETLTISDAGALGYGLIISDTMTMSDAFVQLLSIAETLSDTMTMSDSLGIGYGDAIPDTLTMSDVLGVGYGEGVLTETLTITDQPGLGYGLIISDTLTMSDAFVSLLSIAETLSDTMTMSDSLGIGYGDAIPDTMTMSDSLGLGYGEGNVDQLTFSDSAGVGYGFVITDTMTMSDSVVVVLGIVELFSDQLVMSDALAIGYGEGVLTETLTISDATGLGYGLIISDTMTMSDSVVIVMGLNINVTETLTITDSISLGYGLAITDTMTMSDSDVIVLGFAELFSDQLVMSDSLIVGDGQGIVESLTFVDANAVGYGDLIADTMTMSDAFASNLGTGNTEVLSDTMTMSDALAIGYGDGITDNIFNIVDAYFYGYSKNPTLGGADLLSTGDNLVINLKDADVVVLGLTEVLSDDNETNWADSLNYGFGFSETLTFSDALAAGYGNSHVEQLVFVDASGLGYGDQLAETLSMSDVATLVFGLTQNITETLSISDVQTLGYGFAITDTMVMSDAVVLAERLSENFTETLTITDSMSLGYGFAIAETLSMLDALGIGYGEGNVEQLVLIDFPAVGYGFIITDTESANWLDAFVFSLSTPTINLVLSDQNSMSDQVGTGYGNANTDTVNFSEMVALVESFEVMLADATPGMLEAAQLLFNVLMNISETLNISEQIGLAYGFSITEQLVLSDQLSEQLAVVLVLALQDTETANWLDAILAQLVFAPGAISAATIAVLAEMVASAIAVTGQTQAGNIVAEVEDTETTVGVLI